MDENELIELVLKPFMVQANLKSMKTSMFPKEYDKDIRIRVGLGQGVASNVPFIAFLGDGQSSQQGVYPVVAYFKESKRLFLAYGESVAGESRMRWGELGKEKIEEYANKSNIKLNSSEVKYSQEKIYSVYEVDNGIISESDMNALAMDISKIMVEYKELMMEKSKVVNLNMNLDVLGDVFKHTATSYKYYWALSLLDLVKEGRTMCSINEAIVGMMVRAWKPAMNGEFVNSQDKLYGAIVDIQRILDVKAENNVRDILLNGLRNSEVRQIMSNFKLTVPYRFLSPWIEYVSDNDVMSRSQMFENGCPYALWSDVLKMNLSWRDYLKDNCDSLISSVEMKLNEYLNK